MTYSDIPFESNNLLGVLISIVWISALLAGGNACNDNGTGPNLIDTVIVSFNSLSSSNCEVQISEDSINIIIDNQSDFEEHIRCAEEPSINFNTYFVLAGSSLGKLNNVAYVASQQLYLLRDTLYYKVDIADTPITQPQPAHYIISVPIKYKEYQLNEYPIKFIIKLMGIIE